MYVRLLVIILVEHLCDLLNLLLLMLISGQFKLFNFILSFWQLIFLGFWQLIVVRCFSNFQFRLRFHDNFSRFWIFIKMTVYLTGGYQTLLLNYSYIKYFSHNFRIPAFSSCFRFITNIYKNFRFLTLCCQNLNYLFIIFYLKWNLFNFLSVILTVCCETLLLDYVDYVFYIFLYVVFIIFH